MEIRDEILKKILKKIKECEDKAPVKFIVDRIDVVALKELYNDILNNEHNTTKRGIK